VTEQVFVLWTGEG